VPAAVAGPAGAQPPAPGLPVPAAPRSAPPPIEDNSFLVEEAYNQPRGVVQHVGTFQRALRGAGWVGTFTQEWPVGGQRHQLSYTAAEIRGDEPGAATRFGDLALNYRLQARDRAGVLVAPRATVLLPTGSARTGSGAGGVGVQTNLPVTLELSPRWVTHSNVGGTLVPSGEDAAGARARLTTAMLAQSVIWTPRPTFNVLVETFWSRTLTRPRGGAPTHRTQAFVSPGVRFAVNRPGGMQIVPGIAAPFALVGPARRLHLEPGVFAYLSVEHAFARTQ
jgi:hypothetical protein